jgi:hypothetical protein
MKQELLDLIHLNTYIDYSANKASGNDINELLAKCGMMLPDDYLNFLRNLNGFRLYKLSLYGTRDQHKIGVLDAWHFNELRHGDYPSIKEYFVIGEGFEELYCYYPADKKYYILEFYTNELDIEDVTRGRKFENFDSFIDWAVKEHAKRRTEQTRIINKDALFQITKRITDFLEAHNFKKTAGDFPFDGTYRYERQISHATEWIGFDIQVSPARDLMSTRTWASKRYNLIEDFFDLEDSKQVPGGNITGSTIFIPHSHEEFSEQKVNEDPGALASHFISFIDTHIFPAFSLYDNVRDLDAKVNESLTSTGNITAQRYHGHYKMVIARLAGSPMYDEIFKSIVDRFENAIQKQSDREKKYRDYLEATLRLNEKLQKVSPLKDGMLL